VKEEQQLTLRESHGKTKWNPDVSGYYTRQLLEVGTKVCFLL